MNNCNKSAKMSGAEARLLRHLRARAMGRRWPPPAVAVCLRLMLALDLSAAEATKFLQMRRGRS